MAASAPKATELFELHSRIEVLEKENAVLKAFVTRTDRILVAAEKMLSLYGEYHGYDNRLIPAVITGAFPTAGTVDALVFDNLSSGGTQELAGVELGTGRGEVQPYLAPELAEEESDELVAS